MSYKKELQEILKEDLAEIKLIEEGMKDKEIKFTREYFKIGSRVEYSDRDGNMEGTIIGVDDTSVVAVMVDKVNYRQTSRSIEKFLAGDLKRLN